jgi:hypothetical protein
MEKICVEEFRNLYNLPTLKNAVFWDVAPCRGTYRLHLQGRKIRERGTSVNRWLQ